MAYYDWLSVDPASDQRPSLSPYNYCSWNPVGRIDPDGALDDNYTVDLQGNVKLEEKTDDKFDVLYTKVGWDNGTKDKSITVNKGVLDDIQYQKLKKMDLDGKLFPSNRQFINIAGKTEGDNLFEFLGDNTNVEFSQFQFNIGAKYYNIIITTHQDWTVNLGKARDNIFIMSNVWGLVKEVHNHPSGNPDPSGDKRSDGTWTGDYGFINDLSKYAPNSKHFIYTKNGNYNEYKTKD